MTVEELVIKFGSRDIATKIVDHKMADEELCRTQVRDMPDCPAP